MGLERIPGIDLSNPGRRAAGGSTSGRQLGTSTNLDWVA